ncbi:hypothetical protein C8J57DRAFT_1533513 [Mycena rebaudengoi]|nr:hypothetical protein C8J57DRAFT_1533513 [Mycena rebaudengoi]
MNLSGDGVKNSKKIMANMLGIIKRECWGNVAWVNHTDNCLSKAGIPGSSREHAVLATKSFQLKFIDTNNGKGDTAPIYQLTGKPVSTDNDMQTRWIALTKAIPYMVGLNRLETTKHFVNCVWCKNPTHPGHQCPLPRTDNWYGPIPPPPVIKTPRMDDDRRPDQGPSKQRKFDTDRRRNGPRTNGGRGNGGGGGWTTVGRR